MSGRDLSDDAYEAEAALLTDPAERARELRALAEYVGSRAQVRVRVRFRVWWGVGRGVGWGWGVVPRGRH